MAGSALRMQAHLKQFFFDRKAVQDAIGIAEARNLSRIGAFIRTRSRSLLRRRKSTASPGQPPSVHSDSTYATLKNILFSYERSKHAVVTGPIKIKTPSNNIQGTVETVPEVTEFGGNVVILEERWKGSTRWFHRDARYAKKNGKEYKSRVARYASHPFMSVALKMEISAGTIRDVWRASIGTGS